MARGDRPGWFDRLDEALRPFADARTDLATAGLGTLRASLDLRRREAAQVSDVPGVEIVGGSVTLGGHSVALRVFRGGAGREPAPAVLYCHSGAFVLGNLDTDHLQCVELARRAQCTVIAMDYRLAPEHPFPAALDDVVRVFRWVVSRAGELSIDPARIAVAGSSAGGALAATVAQRAAAGETPPVVFQMLHQPVLDDAPTPSKAEFVDTPGFDGIAAAQMWRHYRGPRSVAASVPSRAEDLTGLVPALITCSELDPLRDEALDYARMLMAAGIPAELHVYAGTCHGFDSLIPESDTSQQLFSLQAAALRGALY